MKIKPLYENGTLYRYVFFCPGCETEHYFWTNGNGWTFNGDLDNPTVQPSILTKTGPNGMKRCHCWITDGKIRFFDDCDHELKGQTLELRNDSTSWGLWVDEENAKGKEKMNPL